MIELTWKWLIPCAAAWLAACSGGSVEQIVGIDRGGVRGEVAIGVVTGFGSVFVNGVRYETDSAAVTIDGQPASAADLRLGQVVVIAAERAGTTASAQAIAHESDVIGPAGNMDRAAGTLNVLGQSVLTSAETWWGGSLAAGELDSVMPGDNLRVSGFRDASDRIVATRIDPVPVGAMLKLVGFVRDADDVTRTLRIGGQIVDYSTAALVSGFPAGSPRSGDLVKVTGAALGISGALIADRLEMVSVLPATETDEEAEIEGIVSAVRSADEFDLGALMVLIDADTKFEHGSRTNLVVNARVEIEGQFDETGRLRARRIEFEDESILRIEGDVMTMNGSRLVVMGVAIEADGLTRLASIQPGDCTKVSGFESIDEPGLVIATRLEREDSCGTDKLRGIVTNVAQPQFVILGTGVVTSAGTSFPGGSAANFFASAQGRLVEVKGNFDGSVLVADEIEFKD